MRSRTEALLLEARKALYQHGFDLIKPIGDGGFATIYLVRSRQYATDNEFVVKLIDLEGDENEKLPESFQAEINALSNLFHPHVIQIFGHFTSETLLYIILEYCPNGSLKDMIEKLGCLRPPLLFDVCRQILSALDFCHERGIAHRDVKPSNILIDKHGRMKLADFGLAQHFNSSTQLSQGFAGSLPYLAPEILRKQPFDPKKADIWALGITFLEVVTGSLPWGDHDQQAIERAILAKNIRIPENLNSIFDRALRDMLHSHPENRWSCRDLLALSIFQKPKVPMSNRKSFSMADSGKPIGRAPIASAMMLNKKSETGRRCLVAKKRIVSMVMKQATFDCSGEDSTALDDYERA